MKTPSCIFSCFYYNKGPVAIQGNPGGKMRNAAWREIDSVFYFPDNHGEIDAEKKGNIFPSGFLGGGARELFFGQKE
ncbi:MAG: hypothetical protein E7336_01690 [Clostridiales bacterium]|nr:hypothetical protein [Clostridiales bacterium]